MPAAAVDHLPGPVGLRQVLDSLQQPGRWQRTAQARAADPHGGGPCVDRKTGLTLDLSKLHRVLKDVEDQLPKTLGVGIHSGLGLMVADVVKTKLIRANPPYLNRRTGTLIRSISASPSVTVTENVIRGTFGSNLDYARHHEEGFTGTITVPAHTRKAHRRRGPSGRSHQVKAHRVRQHVAHVQLRARHFLSHTVRDRGADAVGKVRDALRFLFKHWRAPSASDLRGGGR